MELIGVIGEQLQDLPFGLFGISFTPEPKCVLRIQQFSGQPHIRLPYFSNRDVPLWIFSVYQDLIGIVNDSVQNSLCDSAVFFRIGMHALVPVSRFILGAEDHGPLAAPYLNYFQKIVDFLMSQATDKLFIQNQQIILAPKPVSLNGPLQFSGDLRQRQFLQELGKRDVAHGHQFTAGSIAQRTGKIRLAAARIAL